MTNERNFSTPSYVSRKNKSVELSAVSVQTTIKEVVYDFLLRGF